MGCTAKQQAKDITFIYGLFDPRCPEEIRYIGQTCRSVEYRLYEHCRAASAGEKWPVSNWIRKLAALGIKPLAKPLQIVGADESWQVVESHWISLCRQKNGKRLLNVTDGGDGTRGVKMTEETRARMSAVAKLRGNHGGPNRGRKFSDQARAAMSAAHKGKPGRKWSEEERAKRATNKRLPFTEEQRERVRQGHLNSAYVATSEHRAKLAKAARLAWARKREAANG